MWYIPNIGITGIVEISVLSILIYYTVRSMRNTRAWILLKGLFVLFMMYAISYFLNFKVIVNLFESTIMFIGVAVIIVLEPEIRNIIEKIGVNNLASIRKVLYTLKNKGSNVECKLLDENVIDNLVEACYKMGRVKTGALIVIENKIPLDEYIETGIEINADITDALLLNIFEKNTPLHDGALIIRNNKIVSGTCYLPLSNNKEIGKELGTRHRAAIGMSEVTDSIVITVSEETGAISLAYKGELKHGLNADELRLELRNISSLVGTGHNESLSGNDGTKYRILNNWNIKVVVLLGTLLFWYVVTSSIDPVQSVTFKNVDVIEVNTDRIAEVGKKYSILSGDKVNVTITDRKSELDKIVMSDIKVKADFSNLSIVNAIALESEVIGNSNAKIALSESVMKIGIEDLVSHEYVIDTNINGKVAQDKYLDKVELSDNNLVISGAKSDIDRVGSVVLDINVDKLDKDTILNIEPKILDKDGSLLDKEKYELNLDTIQANVKLYNTKLVPIDFKYTFKDKGIEHIISDVSIDKSELRVAGNSEAIKSCDKVKLNIELSLDIGDISKRQYVKNIDITKAIKSGLHISDDDKRLNITVNFKDFSSRTIKIDNRDIDGLPKHLSNTYKITLVSLVKDLSSISLSDLRFYAVKDNTNNAYSIQFKNEAIANGIKSGDIMVYGNTVKIHG